MYVKVTSILTHLTESSKSLVECVAAVIVGRSSCLQSHHPTSGGFLPYRPIHWPLARCRSSTVFSSVVLVASFATGASLLPIGNGDGLRLAHACVVVRSRGVCRGHVSILTLAESSKSHAWSEACSSCRRKFGRRQAAFGHIISQPTGSFLPYRPHQVAAGTLPFSADVSSVRFSRVFAAGVVAARPLW
ncbi:hypothetical protein O9993_05595 [Vibrio lentus]|nr:hypothetical protein [Vibrio lentus]